MKEISSFPNWWTVTRLCSLVYDSMKDGMTFAFIAWKDRIVFFAAVFCKILWICLTFLFVLFCCFEQKTRSNKETRNLCKFVCFVVCFFLICFPCTGNSFSINNFFVLKDSYPLCTGYPFYIRNFRNYKMKRKTGGLSVWCVGVFFFGFEAGL